MAHNHEPGEFCDECAAMMDIAERASFDYGRGVWVHDSLSVYRTGFTVAPSDSNGAEAVPMGTYWLVSRVCAITDDNTTIVDEPIYRNVATPDNFCGSTQGTPLSDEMLMFGPGETLLVRNRNATDTIVVNVEYRRRVIVPAPYETRKRLFAEPVESPYSGSPASDTTDEPVTTGVQAEADVLPPNAFKSGNV